MLIPNLALVGRGLDRPMSSQVPRSSFPKQVSQPKIQEDYHQTRRKQHPNKVALHSLPDVVPVNFSRLRILFHRSVSETPMSTSAGPENDSGLLFRNQSAKE